MERRGPGGWKRTFEGTADIRSGSAEAGRDRKGDLFATVFLADEDGLQYAKEKIAYGAGANGHDQ
jgi:hypothetical protein